jgi:hypothetical protein
MEIGRNAGCSKPLISEVEATAERNERRLSAIYAGGLCKCKLRNFAVHLAGKK